MKNVAFLSQVMIQVLGSHKWLVVATLDSKVYVEYCFPSLQKVLLDRAGLALSQSQPYSNRPFPMVLPDHKLQAQYFQRIALPHVGGTGPVSERHFSLLHTLHFFNPQVDLFGILRLCGYL